MTVHGISIALTIAVLFSGGKVKISKEGMEFELPPLGKGVASMRQALEKENAKGQSASPKM